MHAQRRRRQLQGPLVAQIRLEGGDKIGVVMFVVGAQRGEDRSTRACASPTFDRPSHGSALPYREIGIPRRRASEHAHEASPTASGNRPMESSRALTPIRVDGPNARDGTASNPRPVRQQRVEQTVPKCAQIWISLRHNGCEPSAAASRRCCGPRRVRCGRG